MNICKSRQLVRLVCATLLLLVSVSSMVLVNPVCAASPIEVTVDSGRSIGVNDFSVASKLDYEWERWRDSSTLRQLAEDAGFKLVAFYVWKRSSPRACSYWYESTKTGRFDWRDVDSLVRRIFEIGAEPLLSLCGYDMSSQYLPPGMATNPSTGLPYPSSWAAYSAEWVKHFKAVGLPVKYYEITTEPFKYFGWTADLTKLSHYVKLWNAAARAMRAVSPKILLSQDFITAQRVLDYWLKYGDNVDFLDFHKYDSYALEGAGYYSNAELLRRAETSRFVTTSGGTYGVDEARQKWFNARGKLLPVINSECNLNSAWKDGTDPRIQKMVGAVWTALMLRMSILKGLSYSAYFSFGSNARYTRTGNGFGMINLDNNRPWYPYYVHKWLGNNLKVGDILVESTSSSNDVRPLAWINNKKLNVLIISKVNQYKTLNIHGVQGQIKYYKIDNTISYLTPQVQTGTISPGTPLYLTGYTVILLQSDASTPPPPPSGIIFEDGFESGDFSKWTGTTTTSGETATVASYRPYSGNYHGRFTSNGGSGVERAYSYKDIGQTSEIYVRSYVYIQRGLPLLDENDRFNFFAIKGARRGSVIASVSVQHTGGTDRWTIRSHDGIWSASTGPSMYQWYCVEFYTKIDATNGIHRLWINGQIIIEQTSLNTATEGNIDSVRFGLTYLNGVTSSVNVYGDSFVVSPTYIGPEQPLLFEDGFESGDFSKWTGTTTTSGETATVASYRPYSGNYHGRFTSNGGSGVEHGYSFKTLNEEKVYARGYFRVVRGLPLSDNNDRFYLIRFRAGDQSLTGVGIRRYNGVERWMVYGRDGSSWVWPTYVTSPSIEMNRWYCIELDWQKHASQGKIEVYIDGQKIFEITGINTSYFGNVNSVQFGLINDAGVQNNLIVYVDSSAISKTYIGP